MIRNLNSPRTRKLTNISARHLPARDLHQNLFTKGETFRGTIVKVESGGKVVVSGKGTIFTAFSTERLLRSHVYEFLVRKTRPIIELKVVSSDSGAKPSALGLWASTRGGRQGLPHTVMEILGLVRQMKTVSSTTTEGLEKYMRLADITAENVSEPDTAKRIADCLMASGIFFENKLARSVGKDSESGSGVQPGIDLKHALLRILAEVEDSDDSMKNKATLIEKVTRMLHLIETHQILNLLAMEGNFGWFWFFPVYDDGQWQGAELLTRKTSGRAYTIWISVRLSRLGLIQAKVDLTKHSVGVEFYTESTELAKFVSEHRGILSRGMRAQGLRLASFTCSEAEEDQIALHLAEMDRFEGLHVEA